MPASRRHFGCLFFLFPPLFEIQASRVQCFQHRNVAFAKFGKLDNGEKIFRALDIENFGIVSSVIRSRKLAVTRTALEEIRCIYFDSVFVTDGASITQHIASRHIEQVLRAVCLVV